ncbi:DUF5753 domain-containing protein [Streptomyces sp. NPDC001661]
MSAPTKGRLHDQPDYARAMLRLVVDFHGFPDDIEAGVTARTARANLIGQGGRTHHVLLGESALRRNVGGTQVMHGQLERLLESIGLHGLALGIIPDRAQLEIYPGNSFGLFDGTRVEIENYGDTPTVTEDTQVAIYRRAFEILTRSAVYGDEARARIRAELREL